MQHLDEGTIHAWLDQALPPDEATRVVGHVAECEACAQAVAEARGFIAASSRILTALDEVPAGVIPSRDTVVPGDALAALRARRARERETARRRWWTNPQAVRAASVAFLAVASGTVLLWSSYGPQPSRGVAERAEVTSPATVAPDSVPASGAATAASASTSAAERGTNAPPADARGAEPVAPLPAPPPSPTGGLRSLADRAEAKPLAQTDSQGQMAKTEVARGDSVSSPRVAGEMAERRARADEPPRIPAIRQQATEPQRQQVVQQGLDPRTQQRLPVAPPSPLQTSATGRAAPTAAPAEADLAAVRTLAQALAGCYRLTSVAGVVAPYALPSELSLDSVMVAMAGDSSWRRAVPMSGAHEEFAWRPRTETRVDLVIRRDAGTSPVPVSVEIRTSADSRRQAQDESVVAVLVRAACER